MKDIDFRDDRPLVSIVGSFSEVPTQMDSLVNALNNFPLGIQAWSLYPTSEGLRTPESIETIYYDHAENAVAIILVVGRGVPHPQLDIPFEVTPVELQYIQFWHHKAAQARVPYIVALWADSHRDERALTADTQHQFSEIRKELSRHHWCFKFRSSQELSRGALDALSSIQSGQNYEYDVAISFAGPDRNVARSIAGILKKRGFRVFFDEFEAGRLWGCDLVEYFGEVFESKARYALIITSKHYPLSEWARHERQHAQSRQLREPEEYILQLRLDSSPLPGFPRTIGYLNYTDDETVAHLIEKKLRKGNT